MNSDTRCRHNVPLIFAFCLGAGSLGLEVRAQNGGPGPDLGPGLGVQRVDTPNIQNGNLNVFANGLGSVDSGGLTQMAVTDAFADTLFFSDRDGEVRRFDINTGTASVLFDVDNRRSNFQVNGAASGQGMRGLAFHPDFNSQGSAGYGKLYTAFEEAFGSTTANRPLLSTNALGQPFQSDGGRQDGVIVEWDYDFNTDTVLAGSGRDVYRIQIPYSDHVLQQIGFNPHSEPGDADYGLLYAGIGDGGGPVSPGPGVDTNRVGQDFRTPLSSIIRIDPIQQSGATSFGIPNDNPFAGVNEDPNIPGEIFAKGFRHPQTLGFDRTTGKIFNGDIGQNNLDEINVIESGANYGFSEHEGTYVYLDQRSTGNGQNVDISLFEIPLNSTANVVIQTDGGSVNQTVGPRDGDEFSYPAIQLDHIENANNGATAVVGGYVYDGSLVPQLQGQYLFGFLSSSTVAYADASALDTDGTPEQPLRLQFSDEIGAPIEINQALGTGSRTLMRFGQDLDGEIYVFSQITGNIVRLEAPLGLTGVAGDVNQDGVLDATDIEAFQMGWLADTSELDNIGKTLLGDLNLSGQTNLADVALLHGALTAAGLASPFGAENVPEPGCYGLMALGTLFVLRFHRCAKCLRSQSAAR